MGEPGELVAEGVGEWLTVGREFLEEALVGNNGVYGLCGFVSCSNGTERSWRSLMRGEELVVRQLQRRGQPTGRHSSARQGRGEVERAAKRRVDGRATANRLACGSRGLEEGTAGRMRLGERDCVRYAAGVRTGKRARRCSSTIWR